MRRRHVLQGALGWTIYSGAGLARALAQEPVSLIVPDLPGSDSGTLARALRPMLERALAREMVVDFRPGAGGVVGLIAGAHGPADGTSLTLLTPAVAEAPWLSKRMDCTPEDFAVLGRLTFTPAALCVRGTGPYGRLSELVADMRTRPAQVAACATTSWAAAELAQALFLARAGLSALPVAGLRGAAERLSALRRGEIDFAFASSRDVLAHSAAAELRMLAVTGLTRGPDLPAVPCFHEQGIDLMVGAWRALAVPAATPASVRERLSAALEGAIAATGLQDELARLGLRKDWLGPEAARAAVLAEYRDAGTLFTGLGISVRAGAAGLASG